MTTTTTSAWNPLADVPVEVLRMAYWSEGPALERDLLLSDYLGCLERLTDPQLRDECLLAGCCTSNPKCAGRRRRLPPG